MVQIERSKVDVDLTRARISIQRDGSLSPDVADGPRDCQLCDPSLLRCPIVGGPCNELQPREIAKAQVGAAHGRLGSQRLQRSACRDFCPDRTARSVRHASEHRERLDVEVGLEGQVITRVLELHERAGQGDARSGGAHLQLVHADCVAVYHQVARDTLDLRLPILQPYLSAARGEAYAMAADLLPLHVDTSDRQSNVEALTLIFEAHPRVRYRKLPDQVINWLG